MIKHKKILSNRLVASLKKNHHISLKEKEDDISNTKLEVEDPYIDDTCLDIFNNESFEGEDNGEETIDDLMEDIEEICEEKQPKTNRRIKMLPLPYHSSISVSKRNKRILAERSDPRQMSKSTTSSTTQSSRSRESQASSTYTTRIRSTQKNDIYRNKSRPLPYQPRHKGQEIQSYEQSHQTKNELM